MVNYGIKINQLKLWLGWILESKSEGFLTIDLVGQSDRDQNNVSKVIPFEHNFQYLHSLDGVYTLPVCKKQLHLDKKLSWQWAKVEQQLRCVRGAGRKINRGTSPPLAPKYPLMCGWVFMPWYSVWGVMRMIWPWECGQGSDGLGLLLKLRNIWVTQFVDTAEKDLKLTVLIKSIIIELILYTLLYEANWNLGRYVQIQYHAHQ